MTYSHNYWTADHCIACLARDRLSRLGDAIADSPVLKVAGLAVALTLILGSAYFGVLLAEVLVGR